MRNWFFLIVRVLCCILAISSAASAKDNLLGQDAEISKVATIQPCPGENASGMVCHIDADGKVVAQGRLLPPDQVTSLTSLINALNSELRNRDKQHAQLQGELRQRDRELDKRDTMLAQLRDEVTAYRQKVLDLEERKLAAQDKHTGALEQQNQRISEQVEAIHANTAAQARIATGVLFVLPAALVVGLLISAFVVRGSIATLSAKLNEVLRKASGDLEDILMDASHQLVERLTAINNTFCDYFRAEAKRQGLNFPVVPPGSNNGNGHHKKGDTLPPSGPGALSVEQVLASLDGGPDPAPVQPEDETRIIGSAPTLVEATSDAPEEPAQYSTPATDERMRELDSMPCFQRPGLGGVAAAFAREQGEFPIETPSNGHTKLADTIVEKSGFFARFFGRRGASSAPSIA